VITPYEFESDLKYLSSNNYTAITMNQLVDYACYGKSIPEKPIILSFDDGYLDNYRYVYPLLKKYRMKVVLSIIGKNTDDFTRVPDDNLAYSHVTWPQLSEMIDSGYIEVQNHTYNLHSNKNGRIGCRQMSGESDAHYEQVLSEDLLKCQDEIKSMTGVTPNTFTYPYGEISRNTDSILKKLGFKATLSCKYGVNVIRREPDSLFDLKRICRLHGKNLEKTIKEGMETLRFLKE
jgi:Predicted xylanase/chitin deacetylase